MNTIRLFAWELESMPEYSSTLPTATTLWKMWKANTAWKNDGTPYALNAGPDSANPEWVVYQFVPCAFAGRVGIRRSEVVLKHGPAPRIYVAPDWSNHARWRAERDGFLPEDHPVDRESVGRGVRSI